MNLESASHTESDDDFDTPKADSWSVFWIGVFVACIPWLLAYFFGLWKLEHYRFFPFAVLVSGWLIYTRWDRKFHAPRGWLGWIAVGTGLATIAFGTLARSPWLGAVGSGSLLFAFCFSVRDRHHVQSLIALCLPVLLTLRLPLNFDQILVVQLQHITTALSSVVLDLIGIPHAVSNNVIQLASRELFVAEACSGIQSVFTLLFLAVAIVALNRRPIWTTLLYVGITLVLAVATNVLRVCVIAIADSWMSLDLAMGWQHDLVGYLALGVGVLLLLSFDQLIRTMIHPVHIEGSRQNPFLLLWQFVVADHDDDFDNKESASSLGHLSLAAWRQPMFRYAFIGLCGVLTVASTVQSIRLDFFTETVHYLGSEQIIFRPAADVFDKSGTGLVVTNHETSMQGDNPRLGANADVWTCKVSGLEREVQVVLSQPYVEWHELCFCYENIDWLLLHRDVVDADEDLFSPENAEGDVRNAFAVARFKQPGEIHGYLIYTALAPDGQIVHPPAIAGSLQNRFGNLFAETPHSEIMMFQMFVSVQGRITTKQLSGMKSDFQIMRRELQKQIRLSN